MTIFGVHMDGTPFDTRQVKLRRSLWGAFYGFLTGIAFVYTAGFIDIWLHPELPIGMDWQLFWSRLALIGLGLALVGAVTCWWNEAWLGLVSGAVVASALSLMVALYSAAAVTVGLKVVVLVFILIPIAAMTFPLTWIMRWLVERHLLSLNLNLGIVRILGLMVITLLLGAGGGYFMKMPGREVTVMRHFDGVVQNVQEKSAVSDLEGIQEHSGMPYKLYSQDSVISTEGFELRAVFEDGYVVQCTGVVYPGRTPYLSNCSSGSLAGPP